MAPMMGMSFLSEPMEGGREQLPVITCHRTRWVAGGSPLMPRPCLTCWGRAQGQDKRASAQGTSVHSW